MQTFLAATILFLSLAYSICQLKAEVTVTATPLIPPKTARVLSQATILQDIEQKSEKAQKTKYVNAVDFSANEYELQKKKTGPKKPKGLTLKKKRNLFGDSIKKLKK